MEVAGQEGFEELKHLLRKELCLKLNNTKKEMKKIISDHRHQYLAVILALLLSFIIRTYLSQFNGYKVDVLDFKIWSRTVYYSGILNFYSSTWSDYPPFYIYILWIVGAFYKLFSFSFNIDTTLFTILIKTPANIADIAASFLIFLLVKKYSGFKTAYLSMIFYAFNPAIIYNSAIWGQADSVNTLFILLALMFIVSDKPELAGVSMAVAVLTKPLSLVILPFIAVLMIKNQKPLRLIKTSAISAFVFIALALPFYLNTSLYQLIKIYTSGYSYYAYNSMNAFNFWALLGFWKPDNTIFLFLSYRTWGYISFGLLFVYVTYLTIKNKDTSIYLAAAVLFFGFFMLFTRVHERYLFPIFAPLAIAASFNRRFYYVYWITAFAFLFNLHFVLQYLNSDQFIPDGNPYVLLTSGINSVVFIYTMYWFWKSSGGKLKTVKDYMKTIKDFTPKVMKEMNFISINLHMKGDLKFSFRHLLIISLFLLTILSPFSRYLGFIYVIILTLFLPGFVVVNLFLKELECIEKLVLTFFLSVLLSTQVVYWLSMVLGYSKLSVVLSGLIFVPALIFIRLEKTDFRPLSFKLLKHPAVILSLGVFLIFYVILSSTIWIFQVDTIILSGSNWQDTPMHLGIIESLNQGNFPPQMPYYSGVKMTYHYFVDFHTAIIEKMADTFNPRLLVYLNSFFAGIFALAIYVIANYITKSWKSAVFAGIIGVFGGGFSYIRFFEAFSSHNWSKFSDLFLQNYVMEWKKFFEIVPIFETLLQSRPQMVGLPGLALASYFLYRGFIDKDIKKMILAGLITGLIFPFQVTAFLSIGLIFMLITIYFLFQEKSRFWLKGFIFFLIPVLFSLPFIMAVDPTATSHLSFQTGWWAPDKSPLGLTIFYIGNLGIPFIISFFFPLAQRKHVFFIYSWLLAMLILPNIVILTPESFDMYKFFNFMWIPVAIATGCILGRLYDKKLYIVVIGLIVFSVFTPFLDAAWNLSVKYPGYSLDEYNAGIWVRDNTPQGSVFLEEAGIHSPPADIGGRLRMMGYGTWPYGQGYDIWSRSDDIKKAFNGTSEEMSKMITKHNISYAYIGSEEMRDYPGVKEKFDQYFRRVYSNEKAGIWIYKLSADFNSQKK